MAETTTVIDERVFRITITPNKFGYEWQLTELLPDNRVVEHGYPSTVWTRWGGRWEARRFARRIVEGTDVYRLTMTREAASGGEKPV